MTTVQSPREFLDDFIKHAKHAKKRIYAQCMIIESGEAMDLIEPVLIQKAKEGVDVRFTIDWVWQKYVHAEPDVFPVLNPKTRQYNHVLHKKTFDLIKRWSDAGINFTVTNPPGFISSKLPIFRRNHTKIYVVDDEAVWVGGINFFDLAFEWIDFMVKFTDPDFITPIAEQFHKVNEKRPNNNYITTLDKENKLVVDAGKIGDSIIYDQAIELIRQAKKSLLFVSQFVPDGRILDEIIKAYKQGVTCTIMTSNKDYRTFTKFPYNRPYHAFLNKTKDTSLILHHQRTQAHAKLIIVDDKVAMFGSHNFVNVGVILGTEEIAVRTENPELIGELQKFIDKNTVISPQPTS